MGSTPPATVKPPGAHPGAFRVRLQRAGLAACQHMQNFKQNAASYSTGDNAPNPSDRTQQNFRHWRSLRIFRGFFPFWRGAPLRGEVDIPAARISAISEMLEPPPPRESDVDGDPSP